MKLNKLYTESITHFPKKTQEWLLKEAPHTAFSGAIPEELYFLRARIVDLGFENLGLPEEDRQTLERSFGTHGVRIPNSEYKIRCVQAPESVIELSVGDEPTLPTHWKQGVVSYDEDFIPIWFGRRVRKEQLGRLDASRYNETPDGWLRHD
jgi:hypothetical protein